MNKETIIAPDMQTGLRMVKARFGEEALILDSRIKRSRRRGSLKMGEEVEIIVGLDQGRSNPESLRADGSDKNYNKPRPLAEEIIRLERMVDEMESQVESMDFQGFSPELYPLSEELTTAGLSPHALAMIRKDHAEEVPPVQQRNLEVALKRLERQVNCVEHMALGDLRGYHVLVGGPGVGKSTLGLKLAREAAAAGTSVVLVAYQPGHPGEQYRLDQCAQDYGFEAALAPDPDALMGATRYLVDRDLVLVDMPAIEDEHWPLLDEVERILKGDPLLRHLVVQANGGWTGMEAVARRCDFLAVSKADLGDPLIPALNLLSGNDRSLTFLSDGGQVDSGLELASAHRLLSELKRRSLKAEAAGAGGRG
ncbi:MAG: hypothetical protein GY835_20095 [bacterium]|nr:hypothetical protein [bacterium]